MAKKATKQLPHLRLRIEPKLLARLEKFREKEGRTLTGEIMMRLEQSFETEDRMAVFKESMEARLQDARQRIEESRAWAEKQRQEIRAEAEELTRELLETKASIVALKAKHAADYRELEEQIELVERGAAVVDVLLGNDKQKSELLRLLALKVADLPEGWGTNQEIAARHIAEGVREKFEKRGAS
jgi:hypothetical protein